MSKYKDQIKAILKKRQIDADQVLSIGCAVDDRDYFGAFKCNNFTTLDNDREMRPDIIFDMNKSMQTDGGFEIDDRHVGNYSMVLALNLWEYIYAPFEAHRTIVDFLRHGGLYIGTYPFVYPVHNPAGMDYLRYTPEGVEKLLKTVGLHLESHEYILGDQLLEDFYHGEGMKARAGVNHLIVGSVVTARKG